MYNIIRYTVLYSIIHTNTDNLHCIFKYLLLYKSTKFHYFSVIMGKYKYVNIIRYKILCVILKHLFKIA